MTKRLFDILFSLGALLMVSPVLIGAMIWVALDSRGPIFFRQVRVGRGNREFRIYKFRTMRPNAERLGPQITVGADARVTRSGDFLRKYKIDELPQFLNVLLGDMSVVGPRPEVPRYVELYPAPLRNLVLSVRPGITDLASIEYRDENRLLAGSADPEATYVSQIMPAKLALCEKYVRTRSFVGDLVIIARTLKAAASPGTD
jgi:lipopolysaccharide/colanic/teichoic acid biosynthesis glycosyltransferase